MTTLVKLAIWIGCVLVPWGLVITTLALVGLIK